MRLITTLVLFVWGMVIPVAAKSYLPADFAIGAEYYSVKISPTGEYIALGIKEQGEHGMVILDAKTLKTIRTARFPYPRQVGPFYWVNDERLVIKTLVARAWESEPIYIGELYSVNYDGTGGEIIYGFGAGEAGGGSRIRRKKSAKATAEIVSFLSDDPRHILISSEKWSKDGSKKPQLLRLDVYSGKTKKITQAPLPSASFVVDSHGQPRFATGMTEAGESQFFQYNSDKKRWTPLTGIEVGDTFWPLTLDAKNTALYYVNNANTSMSGLYKYYLKTGKSKHIYTDEKVDISSITYNADRSSVYAIRIDNGYPEYLIFNKKDEEAKAFKSLLQVFNGRNVAITSRTSDNNQWVVHVSSDTEPGTYYIFNRGAKKLSKLFQVISSLDERDMAITTPYVVTASDGTEVPVYLTLPNNPKGPVPLVTLVHGGPHGIRDLWGFDSEVQMLANQGYAVLRVNFRGSGGYGQDFLQAGYRQWGDRIQWDIIDATQWARNLPEIDGAKVCVMGTSFGGYSALQSSILAGDTFDCAVANAGIYDLQNLFEEGDVTKQFWGEAFLSTVIGIDKQQLVAFSPTHNVQKLTVPVLIAHGEKDRRAPFSQAEELRDALDKAGKSYEWFVRGSETHGFFDEENRSAYFEKVAAFLSEHLK